MFFRNMVDSFDRIVPVKGIQIRMMSPIQKEAFFEDVAKNGFYLVRPPHKPLLYDDVIRMYQAFPEIKPKDIYVDIFGMKQRKTMRPGVIGYMYMLILKQNSNKNFSARSTFRVNRSNLPAKDIAKKTNRSSYARTPVRLSEIYNLLASISGTDLSEYNVFMRSSALGRKSLDRILAASGNPLKIAKLKVQDNFTNANADILAAKMKTLGLRLYFSPNPEGRLQIYDDTTVMSMHFGEYTVHDYPHTRKMYQKLFSLFEKEMKNFIMIESYRSEKSDVCWDNVFDNPEVKNAEFASEITEDLIRDLKNLTRNRIIEIHMSVNADKVKSKDTDSSHKRGRKSKTDKAQDEDETQKQSDTDEDDSDDIIDDEEPEITESEESEDESDSE